MNTHNLAVFTARRVLAGGRLVTAFVLSSQFLAAQLPAAERKALATTGSEAAAHLQMQGRLPANNRLQLGIGLPLRNTSALTNLVRQIYDRRSTNFHCYLTPEQFAEQFGPTEQDYQRVMDYAKSNGFDVLNTFGNRVLVDVSGSVADIERTFQVHVGTYQHPTENRRFYAPDAPPSVPADLPVLHVSGMDNYVIPHHYGHATRLDKKPIHTPAGGSAPWGNLYIGNDFRNAYIPGSTLKGSSQVVGLLEFDGYTASDIHAYETNAGLGSVTLDNVLESWAPGQGNDEVASDIELAIAMAPNLQQVNVYEDSSADTIFTEMAYSSKGEPRPKQISCSWGFGGDSTIQGDLIEMAVQGQTFFIASGDSGAFVGPDTGASQYYANYMTYVGGTQLFMNGAGASWSNEIVWHDPPGTNFNYFSSTGGVLTDVSIPDFQKGVSMAANGGSSQYRNFPDVALVSRDIFIVATDVPTNGNPPVPGQQYSWVGTSASSPLWAGFMALVNEQAANEGRASIGFLDPALYAVAESSAYASCFHDITSGNNTWYDSSTGTGSPNLYYAKPGYDLCTGWGTPAGTSLLNALVGLSGPVFVDFNYTGATQNGRYDTPYHTLAQGVSGVATSGTIIVKTAGSSSETPTITKAMTIIADDGAATVGN